MSVIIAEEIVVGRGWYGPQRFCLITCETALQFVVINLVGTTKGAKCVAELVIFLTSSMSRLDLGQRGDSSPIRRIFLKTTLMFILKFLTLGDASVILKILLCRFRPFVA